MKGNVRDIYTIFDGNDKQLIIPVYQRNYDWGEKQCERLFDDLVDVIKKKRPKHFFGAVVGKPSTGFEWVVIDGQQRLTTTSLVMLALANSLANGILFSEDPELAAKIRRNYLEGAESSVSKETKLKLKPVKHDLEAYRKLLMKEEPIEQSSVTANYRYFMSRIAEGELTGDELWTAIRRLEAMILDLEDHDEPQRIFESLNSTGKELKESDKIRNLVLMGQSQKTQEHLYEFFWNPIERNVDFNVDTFVHHYLVSQARTPPRRSEVYETFKDFLENSEAPVQTILESMRDYSEYFRDLHDSKTGIPRADKRLRRFNLLRHEIAMPTLLPLLGAYREGKITADDFAGTIEIIDAYVFRRIVVGAPSNSLNKIFATLYNDARRLRREGISITDVIAYLLLRRADTNGRFPTDDEFRDSFFTHNFFDFTAKRPYLFECLENNWSKDTRDIASALERGDLSVEHVMPQSLTKEWREELGPDAEEIHHTWLHRIGNLTITGYNAEYSNSSFTTKKTTEYGFNESPYRLNANIKQTNSWTEDDIRQRNEALTQIAMDYWPMIKTDFESVREPLPTLPMGEDTTFTNRVIVSYEFDGSTNTVSSFRDMIRFLIRQLLAQHREAIYTYATEGGVGFTVGEQPSSRYQEQVAPGLWVTTSNPTDGKMSILRALFHRLGIDTDELVFTLRPSQGEEPEDSRHNPYAELIKFAPQFESLEGTDVTENDIAEVRAEFTEVFDDFEVADWQAITEGRDYGTLADASVISKFSVEEALAAIMMVRTLEAMLPGHFLKTVIDGAMARWLNRITELTESQKTAGKNTAEMWARLTSLVDSIPRGKWASYGDLAKAIKSAAQPVGNYLATNPVKNAHRVLRSDGTISEGFSWFEENDKVPPRVVLEQEGLSFDDAGRAAPAQRWEAPS